MPHIMCSHAYSPLAPYGLGGAAISGKDGQGVASFWQVWGREAQMRAKLHRLDRQLLACLQRDNLQTADRLAEQVGRSPSAIARRLRRLRSNGAVAADVSLISEEAAGHPLQAVVQIQLERHARHEVDAVRRRLAASPNVQLVLNLAGAFDILIEGHRIVSVAPGAATSQPPSRD